MERPPQRLVGERMAGLYAGGFGPANLAPTSSSCGAAGENFPTKKCVSCLLYFDVRSVPGGLAKFCKSPRPPKLSAARAKGAAGPAP